MHHQAFGCFVNGFPALFSPSPIGLVFISSLSLCLSIPRFLCMRKKWLVQTWYTTVSNHRYYVHEIHRRLLRLPFHTDDSSGLQDGRISLVHVHRIEGYCDFVDHNCFMWKLSYEISGIAWIQFGHFAFYNVGGNLQWRHLCLMSFLG